MGQLRDIPQLYDNTKEKLLLFWNYSFEFYLVLLIVRNSMVFVPFEMKGQRAKPVWTGKLSLVSVYDGRQLPRSLVLAALSQLDILKCRQNMLREVSYDVEIHVTWGDVKELKSRRHSVTMTQTWKSSWTNSRQIKIMTNITHVKTWTK